MEQLGQVRDFRETLRSYQMARFFPVMRSPIKFIKIVIICFFQDLIHIQVTESQISKEKLEA